MESSVALNGQPPTVNSLSDLATESAPQKACLNIPVISLLPHISSADSIIDLESSDLPIVFQSNGDAEMDSDELLNYQDKSVTEMTNGVFALPPAALQNIFHNGDQDKQRSPGDVVQPILNGVVKHRLSISNDGFIQMRDYKISFDVIGAGKFSEVRVALDTRDGQQYAMKIFSKTKLQKFNMLLRTSRNPVEEAYKEAAMLRQLSHPNIIQLCDFIDDPDSDAIYIVLELLDHVVIEVPTDSPCTEAVARQYFHDIADGVAHIHKCGIIHRDIKPENLLVSKSGIVKLVDFNFCVELVKDENGEEQEVECSHGTPAYTPPECLLPDQRTAAGRPLDMYALGVTLFVMVHGDLPFRADLLPELFDKILNEEVVMPEKTDVSESLTEVIKRLMEKNPKVRMTMPEMLKHPWMQKFQQGTAREKDVSVRYQQKYSERCSWIAMSSEERAVDEDTSIEVDPKGQFVKHRSRGSVIAENDLQELFIDGYTVL
ncbi:hypothetical protein RvY_19260 [Ramazzottius varieornatus]|uniref:Protein kinase domain-containing protein n=1 Tax=Ramazzottius varieornatus TaxID=947166 RepID=A0A1D1W8T8_RAMVA|nr:hypothetical protein RvY_19260 [Ramazzottius varieornatus]